jgi:hypothetical protein
MAIYGARRPGCQALHEGKIWDGEVYWLATRCRAGCRASYPATGRVIQGAPECASYTFNEEGKVTSFTGGYVMDNRLGNTGELGK